MREIWSSWKGRLKDRCLFLLVGGRQLGRSAPQSVIKMSEEKRLNHSVSKKNDHPVRFH